MSDEVTLGTYTDQITNLIRENLNDEAIAHCRHLLRCYPKHVGTYRLMAEASLEKGDLEGARELFYRVLSADPEDVVSYAGLAILLEQLHLVDQAVSHLERAYELAPTNPEIRKELLRLYSEAGGKPRNRLKLTSGALARLYVQQGLYSQAIQEFRVLSSNAPKRFDIRAALLEALWRAGRTREAAEAAQSLLESLPYCLKANLILGAIWRESELPESETYLQRAQSLDPTNQVAVQLLGARSPLTIAEILVPKYVESLEFAIGEGTAQKVAAPSELGGAAPLAEGDWLATIPAVTEMPAPAPSPTPTEQAPSFVEVPKETPAPVSEEHPTLPAELLSVEPPTPAPAVPAELPTATPTDSVSPPVAPPSPVPEPVPAEPAGIVSDLPPWLRDDLRAASQAAQAAEEPIVKPTVATSSSLPPWLAEMQKNLAEPSEPERPKPVEPVTEPPFGATPSWLTELGKAEMAERQAAEPVEESAPAVETPPPVPTETILPEVLPTPPALTEEVASPPAVALDQPDWLAEASLGEIPPVDVSPTAPSPAAEAESELPDWLRGLSGDMESTSQVASGEARKTEAAPIQPAASPEPVPEPALLETEAEIPQEVRKIEEEVAPVPTPVAVPPPEVVEPPRPTRGHANLEQARILRNANRVGDALVAYDSIVQHSPELLDEATRDLEEMIRTSDAPLQAHRILGDAYTRANRLREALEHYRYVLDRVA